jgi:hypothetical protein
MVELAQVGSGSLAFPPKIETGASRGPIAAAPKLRGAGASQIQQLIIARETLKRGG